LAQEVNMANSAANVEPSSLMFVRHDPDDYACTCLLCLARNLQGEEGEDWEYTSNVDDRLDHLKELETLVKQQPAVMPFVLTDQDIKRVVRGLASTETEPGENNLITVLLGSPKEEAMWDALRPLFRDWDEEHRPHISFVVNTLDDWGRQLKPEELGLMGDRRCLTFPILIVAEAFCKGLIKA
jgi:hypothetical protein